MGGEHNYVADYINAYYSQCVLFQLVAVHVYANMPIPLTKVLRVTDTRTGPIFPKINFSGFMDSCPVSKIQLDL